MDKELIEIIERCLHLRMGFLALGLKDFDLDEKIEELEKTLLETFSDEQKALYLNIESMRNAADNEQNIKFYKAGIKDTVNILEFMRTGNVNI